MLVGLVWLLVLVGLMRLLVLIGQCGVDAAAAATSRRSAEHHPEGGSDENDPDNQEDHSRLGPRSGDVVTHGAPICR